MPARLLMPDPGFMHHPGKSAFGGITPKEGPGGMEDIGLKSFSDYGRRKIDNLSVKSYQRYKNKDLLESKQAHIKRTGMDSKEAERYFLSTFLSEFGIKPGETIVFKDVINEPLIIGQELFTTAGGRLKITKKGREQYLKLLAWTIRDPYEIWLVPQKMKSTGKIIIRRRYIAAFSNGSDNKITGFVAFDYAKHGWEGVTAFPPDKTTYADGLRNGVLVYKK